MNKLLPKIDKLTPITIDSKTFFNSPLNKDFQLLSFKDKLQVLNDIVRQSMIYTENVNPLNDIDTLIGDDYTAALVSMNYLKELNVGRNYKIVFAKGTSFDNNIRVVLFVDDDNNNTYLFDATPKVRYKAGYVESNQDIYEDYIIIDGELEKIFLRLRGIDFLLNRSISNDDINEYISFLNYALKYEVLRPYINKLYDKIKRTLGVSTLKYDSMFNKNCNYDIIKMLKQVKIWSQELKDLISSNKDYKRQLELAQNITYLQDIISGKSAPICNLGTYYSMSELTPRLFLENNLTLVMIKPSAYIFNFENEVKMRFLEGKYDEVGEYFGSLGEKNDLGLIPMKLFHPHGYKYVREMTGPTEIFLVNRSAEEVGIIKKKLRQEFKQRVKTNEVMWFDKKTIQWNPICLNFAHSSDDPCEACMGYTMLYPEYQVMTRFMYPNPLIIEEEKNGRIRI